MQNNNPLAFVRLDQIIIPPRGPGIRSSSRRSSFLPSFLPPRSASSEEGGEARPGALAVAAEDVAPADVVLAALPEGRLGGGAAVAARQAQVAPAHQAGAGALLQGAEGGGPPDAAAGTLLDAPQVAVAVHVALPHPAPPDSPSWPLVPAPVEPAPPDAAAWALGQVDEARPVAPDAAARAPAPRRVKISGREGGREKMRNVWVSE